MEKNRRRDEPLDAHLPDAMLAAAADLVIRHLATPTTHGQYLRRASSALVSMPSPDPSDVILGYELLASIGDDGERNILNVAHWMDSPDIGR